MVDMGQKSTLARFIETSGITLVWALIAVLTQSFSDSLVLRLPVSIAPPQWWWYSPIPWPQSILTAILFAVVAALFVRLCVRAGISTRVVITGVCLALVMLWAWSAVDHIGYIEEFGFSYTLAFTRIGALVRLAGTAGSLLGVFVVVTLMTRRARIDAVAAST